MTTYLDVVNDVLMRLREPVVTAVANNSYSKLIGVFVNDAKREVENAYDWNALSSTITINTVADTYNYSLPTSKTRFRVIDILNDTSNKFVNYQTTHWFNEQFLLQNPVKSSPDYYNFNGVDSNGDTQVDLYPIPNGAYTLRFNLTIPQPDITVDSTRILVPTHIVAMLAYAKAIAERGEDGGNLSSEAYALYKSALSDAIAIERNHYLEDMVWVTP
jgi:hypothetical protein